MTTDEIRSVLTEAIRTRSEIALTSRDGETAYVTPLAIEGARLVLRERGWPHRAWTTIDLDRIERASIIASWSAR